MADEDEIILSELSDDELVLQMHDDLYDGLKEEIEEGVNILLSRGWTPYDVLTKALVSGMTIVGNDFRDGILFVPEVLLAANAMKGGMAILKPLLVETGAPRMGKMVIGTVKGDIHDIGKNLVDIILSNNGFETVNIGIKQPINAILEAAEEHNVDVIGLSGLLVKSTQIMKENLEEMNLRGVAERWPVILGGAALTRSFVEQDLAEIFDGEVRYARDAFEGLRLMDALVKIKRGDTSVTLPPLKKRVVKPVSQLVHTVPDMMPNRSDVASDNTIPTPPFWGSRVVKGIPLRDYASFLDERATFMGQWGLKPSRADDGASYEELVETEGKPRLRYWLDRILAEGIMDASVVYGYFPAGSSGDDMIILHHQELSALLASNFTKLGNT